MLSQHTTPIKVSQEAAAKLPRWGLITLLAVFTLSGFFATDLWTPRDIDSFGAAWLTASGAGSTWLLPHLGNQVLASTGPLTLWVTAIFLQTLGSLGLGWLSDVACLRLASSFWFTVSVTALWFSAFRLAMLPEAKPMAFAFGGEAKPKDFARSMADSAVMLLIATFGIITRQHEAVPDSALIAIAALNLLSLTIAIRHPARGSLLCALSVSLAVLACTLFAGVWLLIQSLIVLATLPSAARVRDVRLIILVLGSILGSLLWPAVAWYSDPQLAQSWFSDWAITQVDHFGPAGASTYLWFAKHSLWFLLPLWPLMVAGLVGWKFRLAQSFLFVPLVVTLVTFLGVVFSSKQSADSVFLACLPALSVFAAFSLLVLRRGWENILDWFGITIFSLGALTVWLYWIAWFTGLPPKMHQSIVHLAPNALPAFDWGFVCAILVSLAWIALLVWRITHRPVIVWRGPWINAMGITVVSIVALGLFHTATNDYRSLQPTVQKLDTLLTESGWQSQDCVRASQFSPEQIGVFRFYSQGPLTKLTNKASCRWTLLRENSPNSTLPSLTPMVSRPRSSEYYYVLQSSESSTQPLITVTKAHE